MDHLFQLLTIITLFSPSTVSPSALNALRRLAYLEGGISGDGCLASAGEDVVDRIVDWDWESIPKYNPLAMRGDGDADVHAQTNVKPVSDVSTLRVRPGQEDLYLWPAQDELKKLSVEDIWKLMEVKKTQLYDVVKRKLAVSGMMRFDTPQIERIMQPVPVFMSQVRSFLESHSRQRVSSSDALLSFLPEYADILNGCVIKAHTVNRLSRHLFASLRLLLCNTKNSVIDDWSRDVHLRASRYVNSTASACSITATAERNVFGETEEENCIWEQKMLELCRRYESELQVQHEIAFLKFFIQHREKTVPYLPGSAGLRASATLSRLRHLLQSMEHLAQERQYLLTSEIDMIVKSREEAMLPSVEVERPFVTLPETLESVLMKQVSSFLRIFRRKHIITYSNLIKHVTIHFHLQADNPSATRDSVLSEYLQIVENRHSLNSDISLHAVGCVGSSASISLDHGFVSLGLFVERNPPAGCVSHHSRCRDRRGCNLMSIEHNSPPNYHSIADEPEYLPRDGTASTAPASSGQHRDMLYHPSRSPNAKHVTRSVSENPLDASSSTMQVDEHARQVIQFTWVKVLTHMICFYALSVFIAQYTGQSSPLTACFDNFVLILREVPSLVFSFEGILCFVLALVILSIPAAPRLFETITLTWERIVWRSFLRAFALAGATILLQMEENVHDLWRMYERVEWVSTAARKFRAWRL